MKSKLRSKLNKKTLVGVGIILLTALYLLITTVLAQSETKNAGTGIEYKKDHLSYGDVWAFDSAAHTASNYNKADLGTSSFYSNSSTTNSGTTNFTRYFYSEVTTATRSAPTGTTVPKHAFTRFFNGISQGEASSPVDANLTIPVMTATVTNNTARYSVVPDTKGTYYVYVYSENDTPAVNYAMLDSPQASIDYNEANGLPGTALEFEKVVDDEDNYWYRASIEVATVRWHAVALNDPKQSGSNNSPSGDNKTYYGEQDVDTELIGGGTTYYYNQWTTTNVDYNTVIVFQFDNKVKLGPVTKTGDTITINNPDAEKGDVTAYTIFGEEIEINKAVEVPHCPVIIHGEAKGAYMLDEVKPEKGNGQVEASGKNYVYDFEETSEISVSWTKLVNLPSIEVTGGSDDITMNFFGAKTATITHPGGEEREYTFTADFDDAFDLESLAYSYTITDLAGKTDTHDGILTEINDSFSVSNVSYQSIVVTFTATDKDGDTFKATCTINLSATDANSAPFKVVNSYYWTWEEAVKAAAGQSSTNNKRVILNANYTLPSDLYGNGMLENGKYVTISGDRINYDLPAGVVFIVPHAADFTYVTATGITNHTYAVETQITGNGGNPTAVTASVYRELTVSSGASINLEASDSTTVTSRSVMSVGATTNGSEVISGAHGNVHLMEGAEINIEKNAVLSACGYVYGEGTINVKDGGSVYMPFSMADFRGGGYTVGAAARLSSNYGIYPLYETATGKKGISPFIRYTMNAIQSKLTINSGAKLVGYINMNASSADHNITATIIGSGEGLIQTSSGTIITITYDADTYASYSTIGRTKLKIEGDAKFGNLDMQLKISYSIVTVDASIDTSKINFPIPYNYDIEIASGTFTMPNPIMLLPGASVTVAKGATLNVSSKLTIYDGLHDYTSSGIAADSSNTAYALKGWEKGSGSNPASAYSDTVSTYTPYPSTAALQGATFGGSGSADLIVNGTMNLQSGSTIAGIIQTGDVGAVLETASGIGTSTTTQIGLAGQSDILTQHSYFAGATVRTLTGEILDTGTGNRTPIVGGMTYYASEGTGNISSYEYTLYYDSKQNKTILTDEVACILQGSWWNYAVDVHMILDGDETGTVTMYFAHGAALPDGYFYDEAGTRKAEKVENASDLYFIGKAEAKIIWADGSGETKYPSVRNAVQAVANKGDRIVLLVDLDGFSSVIGPRADQDFIFDMDGHTINYRSTPFVSTSGGKLTVYVGKDGEITNKVGNKYYDSPVLMVNEGSTLYLYLDGGTISVTGDKTTTLVNGGVENSGTLYIDLGGGKWTYKTGLVVPKSDAAANQHHDLTVMAPYQSKAMFNNMGTLTITDTVGGGKVTTDLLSNGTTLTATTPTTNYVSVIRNNAGATLYLGGGTFTLEPLEDEDGDPILSTAATPIPMVTYSAVVLNFGDIRSADEGTALSMTGSGSYVIYNMKGATMDLDLRGGTLKLAEYEKGTAAYAAMYNSKYVVVNDGVMTLRSSEGQGKVLMSVEHTTGALNGILNSNNAAIFSTLALDGIDIEVLHSASASSYGVYNRAGSNITGIKDTNITMALGQALNSTGSATTTTTIGDIINSTFTVSKRYASEDGTVAAVTGSNAFVVSYTDIGNIKDSKFNSVDAYALSATSGSTIKSITGGKFTSTASGGLNLGSLASAATYPAKAAKVGDITKVEFDVQTIGINAAGAAASAYGKAVGPEIGNIVGCTFHTNTGNGMTIAGAAANASGAAAGPTVGDITGCTFNVGSSAISISGGAVHATGGGAAAPVVGDITDCEITSAAYGIYISGAAGNTAFPDHAIATVGDFTGNTVHSGTNGAIYLTYAHAGAIDDCRLTSSKQGNSIGVIHMISLSSVKYIKDTTIVSEETATTTNNTAAGIYTSGGVTIGDIIHCEITTTKGPAISHNATAASGVSTIGNIERCTIISAVGGIAGASGQVTATAAGAAPVFGDIIDTTFETGTYGISIAGSAATANGAAVAPTVGDIIRCTFTAGSYGINISGGAVHAGGAAAAPTVGKIEDCTINAVTYGIQIAGAAGNADYPHAFATVGDFTGTKIYAGSSATAGAYYGIYLSYATAGKIENCVLESGISSNNTGVLHVINRSSVKDIKDTPITVKDTSANTSTAGIYTSASTIGDIIHCEITASKGPAISHNATAALGVSTIGNITDCTIKSGAGGIVGAGGVATATAKAAAPVIGDITKTTFDTVTYGISIGSAGANTYGIGAGAVVGKITGCTVTAGSYGIQIAGGAGTAAENYEDVGFAKVGDITGTTVNSGTYSIYLNYCKGGVIENCKLNATNPAANSYVLGNANGSYIKHIKNTPITVTAPSGKSYGVYNNGGEIGLIENLPINAPYGIYNLNVRVTAHTTETGSTISYYGRIGTIKDIDVTVAQYALQNRGVIDEIVGKCSFVASNPSAQVPWKHGTIANGNAAANTFVNYNTWWGSDGNSTIWKQTDTYDSDGNLTRTVEYKWDDEHMPTIGKISGDIKIIAENTSNSAAHGVAMINNGIIKEISGDVAIETYVHPQNTAITSSSYALQNTSGGRIDKITGNVKISAGAYAIQNSTGQLYIKNEVTYKGETATSGQETEIYRTYYHDYTGIGEITGDGDKGIVIEATAGSYALENHARVGNITGKVSITADKGSYAIQNTTGTTINIIQTMSWPGADQNTPKTYHQEYVMATIGTIGGGNSEILISSNGAANNTYTLQNNGRIEAILEGVIIKDLTGYVGMPTVFNSEGSYTELDYTYKHLRYDNSSSRYYTEVTRDYVYEQPYIGEIRGVTMETATNYALRNTGYIGSITKSNFKAATGYGIDNTLSYAAREGDKYARETVQIYYGATPLAITTSHLGETTIWFHRDQATIGEIDNVTITVESGNYGIQNAGIINSITNSTIDVKAGNYAIGNSVRAATGEDVSMMKNYIYLNESGNYVATVAASITDKVWTYAAPTIKSIGEGNTIQAVSQTIYNMGHIGEIGSAEGKHTTITATGDTAATQYAIYNYQGLTSKVERLGVATDTNTYTGAKIGIIHNVSVNSQKSYAIYNIGAANTYHATIVEIAEGTEVYSAANHAVYNHATNAEIKKITGGIFTTGEGTFYAIYNNSTTFPIEITGGFFKGGADPRANAIYQPDDKTRYTYPVAPLSERVIDVRFADGETGENYYFIVAKITISFDPNGALEGDMKQIEINLIDPEVTLPKNGFVWKDYSFKNWATNQNVGETELGDGWTGTGAELQELLQELLGQNLVAGETITLYAVWAPDEITTYRIEWGAMNFIYTLPTYEWDAATASYVQTDDAYGWSVEEDSDPRKIKANAIKIKTGDNDYTVVLRFGPYEGHYLGMLFSSEDDFASEGSEANVSDTFTAYANDELTLYAMLTGEPNGQITNKTPVGTITIELTPINP